MEGSPDELIRRMTDRITHRGPDAGASWVDGDAGVALGHRRLAILDLTAEGAQPMVSASGRYVLVFNGEIYNYLEIRAELERTGARTWRGHSDTEVMLAAFEDYGLEDSLKRFVGMFALALWDRQHRELVLARDRLGEKPLYYGRCGGTFLFGSELKALRAHPSFGGVIDRNALALLFRHNYIPTPHSIYSGVHKLFPGTYLKVRTGREDPQPVAYWSVNEAAELGQRDPFVGSDEEAIEQLEFLLRRAVRQQMLSDVPLGAFLSGGVDSSAIVALMQAQSTVPIRTFTIGFQEQAYNEAEHAKAVARHLGTDHTELYVTPQQAIDVIPLLPTLYDEPFADSSQVPTFLLSALARRHVTVSLSGDAGDELFAGYNRYVITQKAWRSLSRVPVGVRTRMANLITSIPPHAFDAMAPILSRLPGVQRVALLGDKLHKGAGVLASRTVEQLYHGLVSHWRDPSAVVASSIEPLTMLTDPSRHPRLDGDVSRMMALDQLTYLPDDILTKVDRAAMGVSLETRVPFLDHRVVEFAWRLPLGLKLRGGVGKWVLRKVLYKYVPQRLIERPKQGFGIPIDAWLRGPLRGWAEELLSEERLRREGMLNSKLIREKWVEHQSGARNWQYHLWDVLMFQAWLANEKAPGGRVG